MLPLIACNRQKSAKERQGQITVQVSRISDTGSISAPSESIKQPNPDVDKIPGDNRMSNDDNAESSLTRTKLDEKVTLTSDVDTKKRTTKHYPKKEMNKTEVAPARLVLSDTIYNFGFIDEGDTVIHRFTFWNKGSRPLEILDVQTNCGCTVPTYPLDPIPAGMEGSIKVMYRSKGKFGKQLERISIESNTEDSPHMVYLRGVVRAEVFQHDQK